MIYLFLVLAGSEAAQNALNPADDLRHEEVADDIDNPLEWLWEKIKEYWSDKLSV